MPQKGLDRQSELESLSLEEVQRRKNWRQSHPIYRNYARGNPVEHQQAELSIGRTDIEFKHLPQHPENIDLNPGKQGPSQQLLDSALPYSFHSPKKGKSHFRRTIFQTTYRHGVNQLLKTKGINPYEWEPFDNFVIISAEESDFLENLVKVFPEYYAQTF
ncbi:MAG: hypothetical protein WCK29_00940 [archaeon]